MFEIPVQAAGRLWIMPRPRDLALDLARYRGAGATHIVSMLAPDEASSLGLHDEQALCAEAGLTFIHHSIDDFGLPEPDRFVALVQRLADLVQQGAGVSVHCRAGIGRSGMVCSGVLVALGHGTTQAMQDVSRARGVQVPDTHEQATFIATIGYNLK